MLKSRFAGKLAKVMTDILESEEEKIVEAAGILARTISNNGTLYTFGTGHSFSVALEAVGKRGSFFAAKLLDEHIPNLARFERLPGLGDVIACNYSLSEKDAVMVVSNSGRYPLTVEVAKKAKEQGAKVISISAHSVKNKLPSLAKSGRYLLDVSDVAIDNHGVSSDLLAEIPKTDLKVGSPSTLTGIFIYHLIVEKTVEILIQKGATVPIIKG